MEIFRNIRSKTSKKTDKIPKSFICIILLKLNNSLHSKQEALFNMQMHLRIGVCVNINYVEEQVGTSFKVLIGK